MFYRKPSLDGNSCDTTSFSSILKSLSWLARCCCKMAWFCKMARCYCKMACFGQQQEGVLVIHAYCCTAAAADDDNAIIPPCLTQQVILALVTASYKPPTIHRPNCHEEEAPGNRSCTALCACARSPPPRHGLQHLPRSSPAASRRCGAGAPEGGNQDCGENSAAPTER